eukprot:COSAG01_NODE_937_length_12628_cov_12.665257_11_plen_81_part_00
MRAARARRRTRRLMMGCHRDPYLWRDERGHWHMLMHNMGDKKPLLNRSVGDDGAWEIHSCASFRDVVFDWVCPMNRLARD